MDAIINLSPEFFLGANPVWIAYSGGLDSHVLLHHAAKAGYAIRAIHVNHGLSPHSNTWAQHCAQVCHKLNIDFIEKKIIIPKDSEKSPEELARELRYAVFAELLAPHDILLTAHHAEDQAETVLLQMLRGAGPKGLAAMPVIKPFAKGFHGRPFLNVARADLQAYAEENELHWIEDESNANTDFTRNFLRHTIMPLLKKRWPSVSHTLGRVAENCASAQQLLDEIANDDIQSCQGSVINTLSIKKLIALNSDRQRQLLRRWLNQQNYPLPSAIKLQQIQHDMLCAREDKAPHFSWSGIELRRYRDDLYAMPCLTTQQSLPVLEWNILQPLRLSNGRTLQATLVCGQGVRANVEKVSVHFRQQGESVQLPGRKCRHTVKKLLQEWGVPPWQRSSVPFVYLNDTLIEVVGFFKHDEFRVGKGEWGYVFSIE